MSYHQMVYRMVQEAEDMYEEIKRADLNTYKKLEQARSKAKRALNIERAAYLMGKKEMTKTEALKLAEGVLDIEEHPGQPVAIPNEVEFHMKRTEILHKGFPGFFPTPPGVREAMVDHVYVLPMYRVLEPSAGFGDLAIWLQEFFGAEVECYEINHELREFMKEFGINVIGGDFLAATPPNDPEELYDAVVMNPPFEKKAWAVHVEHAYKFLANWRRLYAVVPKGGPEMIRKGFIREMIDSQQAWTEPLPINGFNTGARKTGVNTELLIIEKRGNE